MQEQRHFTRIPFKADVLVDINGRCFRGSTDNLSLYGVFIRTEQQPEVDEEINVTMPLPDDERKIRISGVVARRASDGIGVKFRDIDVDTFIEIKNIVSTGSGNEAMIMNEFFHYISYKETAMA